MCALLVQSWVYLSICRRRWPQWNVLRAHASFPGRGPCLSSRACLFASWCTVLGGPCQRAGCLLRARGFLPQAGAGGLGCRWGWGRTFTERSLPRQHLWTLRPALNWGLFKCGLGELLPLLVIICFRGIPPYQILRLQSPCSVDLPIPGVAWQVLGRGRAIGGRESRCCQVRVLAVAGDFAARTLNASGGSSRTSELNSPYPPNTERARPFLSLCRGSQGRLPCSVEGSGSN